MSITAIGNKSVAYALKTISVIRKITGAGVRGYRRTKWLAQEFNRIRKRKPRPVKSRTKRTAKRN